MQRLIVLLLLVAQLAACAPGVTMPASAPEAFTIAPGTAITLRTKDGRAVSGELSSENASTVVLDSGSVVVDKSNVAAVETHESFAASPRPESLAPKKKRSSSYGWVVPVMLGWIAGVTLLVVGIVAVGNGLKDLHRASFAFAP